MPEETPIEQRVPPHDLDAEAAVLSACLNDRQKFDEVADVLRPPHFYSEAHRWIFTGCLYVCEAGRSPDVVTVGSWLRENDRLAQVGGMAYMTTVLNAAPALGNTRAYAETVFELWRAREALRLCLLGATQGYGPLAAAGGAAGYVAGMADKFYELTTAGARTQVGTLKEALHSVFDQIGKANKRGARITGLATGFDRYDRITSGLHPGELTILAARPGMGKTSLVLNMASNIAGAPWPDDQALRQGVVVFSLEMPRDQLAQRLLVAEARVDLMKIRTGMLTQSDLEKLTAAAGRLAAKDIRIDDAAGLSMVELRAKLRRTLAEEKGKGVRVVLVAIDYLQLMTGVGDAREQEIASLSRGLKQLSKELALPIVALSQLNRAVETRGGSKATRRPQLSDLRESGAIEQDADNVCFVYRDDYYDKESPDRAVAELIIAKQRNGPTETVRVRFDAQYTRFDNLPDGEWEDYGG